MPFRRNGKGREFEVDESLLKFVDFLYTNTVVDVELAFYLLYQVFNGTSDTVPLFGHN